jgi:hypothetical protein
MRECKLRGNLRSPHHLLNSQTTGNRCGRDHPTEHERPIRRQNSRRGELDHIRRRRPRQVWTDELNVTSCLRNPRLQRASVEA